MKNDISRMIVPLLVSVTAIELVSLWLGDHGFSTTLGLIRSVLVVGFLVTLVTEPIVTDR